MGLFINVKGSDDQNVQVTVQKNGTVEVGTLRSAFQLEEDVPVGLFRRTSESDIALRRRRNGGEFIFFIGEDWKGGEFYLKWDVTRRSRPSSRVDYLSIASELPISHEQLQVADLERYRKFQGYLRNIIIPDTMYLGSVTVINNWYAVTSAHFIEPDFCKTYDKKRYELAIEMKAKKRRMNTELQEGYSIKEWVRAKETKLMNKPVVVYKMDDWLQVETKIDHVDLIIDFVVLHAAGGGLLDEQLKPLELGTAQNGDNYLILGLPTSANIDKQHLSMLKGHVSNASDKAHKKGYIYGAYGAQAGYSGGPVIRLGVNNDLLGIVVSGTRDNQQLVQIIPSSYFKKIIGKEEMILDDVEKDLPTDN